MIAIVAFAIVGSQAVTLFMNFEEFADLFTTPLYFSLISGILLSAIALVRVNIVQRSSISWFVLRTLIGFVNRNPSGTSSQLVTRYTDYKLSVPHFAIWQITKVLLFGTFFVNIMFGFAAMYVIDGNDLGIESITNIFSLPFVEPPTDHSYATEKVIPMIPSLLILVPPLLGVIGLRLLLFIGVHYIFKVITSYIHDTTEGKPKYLSYTSTLEAIVGIGVIWAAFNMFFVDNIDYNSKYAIGGTFVVGFALIAFSIFDRLKSRVLTHMLKRDVYIRIFTILAIAVVVGIAMSVNTSIADAKKIEYLGPYNAQQIGVNRYLGESSLIEEHIHDVTLKSISPNQIGQYIEDNEDVLSGIRVWDWEAAFAKLKPEIGLIPYVNFVDNDILRFDNKLYWTASMAPILPTSVSMENRWYNEHLVYTHVPEGFLTLEATDGQIVDSSELFEQRKIYYGEGGLLEQTWSGYPTNRGSSTAELNNETYAGLGGLEIAPPISWLFEPNFMISYPGTSIHVMRYKDVNDRMETLYPYFLYNLFGKELDSLPVTDGENTYWLVPLIAGFDTSSVPWSAGNPYLRLVGYGLVDTYNGNIQLIKHGDEFFSDMFMQQYQDKIIPMPEWLKEQIRYPQELFNWRTEMYNIYHVTDVDIFIQANEFYEIPRGLDTYYVEAKPPGFEEPEFIGLLSLELRGSQGRNLAGYMVVQNDLPNLGHMQFYEVPIESETKLLGPTSVREALDRDPDFAQLKTLLRNPRIGDNILYRVGEHDTYFIPVYTAGAGGVVAQLGTIAAVGAAFTGEYYVGLGDTQESAFEAYLQKLSGVSTSAITTAGGVVLDKPGRINTIMSIFEENNIRVTTPTSIQIPLSFSVGDIAFYSQSDLESTKELLTQLINESGGKRILMWEEGNTLNFGYLKVVDNVTELHYVSIEVGK
uniref:Uncharacterized protein n=1 Tax=uncultured marine thaumarchaeote KM3_36_B08 TaxID=1456135 RepID=A0A075GZV2_9ARCH|nr:hypothetical protein [uncultured marine thaumarchaeote KM3_36_B08]